jgi:hypothetical protein
MSELRVFKNDVVDWVIATSREDAIKVVNEHYGFDCEIEGGADFIECPMDEDLTIVFEDGVRGNGENAEITKTMKEWIEGEGRCFLCSTEW